MIEDAWNKFSTMLNSLILQDQVLRRFHHASDYIWNWNKNGWIGQIGQIGRNQFDFGFQNDRNGWIRLLYKKLII